MNPEQKRAEQKSIESIRELSKTPTIGGLPHFQNSMQIKSPLTFMREHVGIELHDECREVREYEGSAYIEVLSDQMALSGEHGRYYLLIENDEWYHDNVKVLENILFEWYANECPTTKTHVLTDHESDVIVEALKVYEDYIDMNMEAAENLKKLRTAKSLITRLTTI